MKTSMPGKGLDNLLKREWAEEYRSPGLEDKGEPLEQIKQIGRAEDQGSPGWPGLGRSGGRGRLMEASRGLSFARGGGGGKDVT